MKRLFHNLKYLRLRFPKRNNYSIKNDKTHFFRIFYVVSV
jgi:hypothetical protein